MATRSMICYKENGKYYCAYCHWDGYPEHNGVLLDKYYSSLKKIKNLVRLGGFSELKETVSKTARYAYAEDKELIFDNLKSVGKKSGVNFVYYYNPKAKKWYVIKLNTLSSKIEWTCDLNRYLKRAIFPYLLNVINLYYTKKLSKKISKKDLLAEIRFMEKYLSEKQKKNLKN